MDHRSQAVASNLEDGAGITPEYLAGFAGDPRTDSQEQEYAFPMAELKAIFGAPTTSFGTLVPEDGVDLPSTIRAGALDNNIFTYLNTDTGITWTYNPTGNKWHAKAYQEVVVTGNEVDQFTHGSFPTRFDESDIKGVELVQVAGSEELGINRWDVLTAGILTVKFRGRQMQTGNHKLIIHYEK